MEYREKSFAEDGFDRKLDFPEIRWLSKPKFEELLRDGVVIHPFLGEQGNININEHLNNRIYVGKSIPKKPQTDENNNILGDIQLASFNYLELIGNVIQRLDTFQDENGLRRQKPTWVLRITHNGHTHDLEDQFLVLYIEDPRSYFWSPSHETNIFQGNEITFAKNAVPTYALRAAFDRLDQKYNYIGRMVISKNQSKQTTPKFYANAWVFFDDGGGGDKELKSIFGRIGRSQRLLFVPYRNLEVGLDQFETLCVKPSPVSLKTLCRSVVRSSLDFNQKSIQLLDAAIPRTLLDFVKYPVHLNTGEFLLPGEKLVAKDGSCEMWIDETSNELVIRNSDDTYVVTEAQKGFSVVCVHRFHVIFYDQSSSKVTYAHSFYNPNQLIRFTGEWDKLTWKIDQL